MSALRPPPASPGSFLCPRCGTALHDEQAWCVECGLAARTRIHPPPGWRGPIVATLVVAALLAAGIAFGLVALLDKNEPTPSAATVTAPAATTPAATTPPTATSPAATIPPIATPTTAAPTTATSTTPAPTAPGGATAPSTPGTPTTVKPGQIVPLPGGKSFTVPGSTP